MAGRLKSFMDSEAASAVPLLGAAVLALVLANSPLDGSIKTLLSEKLTLSYGQIGLSKPLLLWINDGLMAVFFLLVGLEIKREVVEGELSRPSQVALPIAGALGGMAVPALIYAAINWNDPVALHGWAIPAATDIAFSLGVLAALGSRVPLALKVFLTTLAIVDDLGAIVVIAVFYTNQLSTEALAVAALCIAVLAILNALGVRRIGPYAVVGAVLWVSVLQSGVHATLAGVALAMFIPLKVPGVADDKRPAIHLEHALKPWSAWLIMPVFAFANAGLSLSDLSLTSLIEPVPLGILAGLFVGKQIGIVLGAGLLILSGVAAMPAGGSWRTLYGVAILGGIGFTMSLFIGTLAFHDPRYEAEVRLGVLAGSVLSAVVGYLVLRLGKHR
ncbi:Na+/H+ antiporter NhaA [Reyranella sp.]|uniref:Na+/H+ antiporter NhaA n=1 Tax=Reyranella sp. TaxID=1929291 RepID=UPI0011FD83FB|nr:Na+/H+ antiporter NhaA [Reyranella sp.]TAJ83581.1 MAG: Na+/H+ antiporter NhaA [Reyranella sp.]